MNNDDKILKVLTALQADVSDIKQTQHEHSKRLDNTATKQDIVQIHGNITQIHGNIAQIHTTLGQHGTMLEALKAGQDDIRENNIRIEQKIDRVAKDVKFHKERIENLEEHTGISNPHKH